MAILIFYKLAQRFYWSVPIAVCLLCGAPSPSEEASSRPCPRLVVTDISPAGGGRSDAFLFDCRLMMARVDELRNLITHLRVIALLNCNETYSVVLC